MKTETVIQHHPAMQWTGNPAYDGFIIFLVFAIAGLIVALIANHVNGL